MKPWYDLYCEEAQAVVEVNMFLQTNLLEKMKMKLD